MSHPPGLQTIDQRPGHPDFASLPWDAPLAAWHAKTDRVVDVESGVSRHEVVFAVFDRRLYAFKSMPADLARHEFTVLQQLEAHRLPAVEPVAFAVTHETGVKSDCGVLVTQYLDHSLPFRSLFRTSGLARYRERLLDAMASLLVRLHVAGVYWGDCSLSNTLFRRDAGELQAFLVDAETAIVQDSLTDGQRRQDIMIMQENLHGEVGELGDAISLPPEISIRETGATIRDRYERLWNEVSRTVVIGPGESYKIQERIRDLNALGFSLGEVTLKSAEDGQRLLMRAIVTDRDYHRHQLHGLTGVEAGDRQAALMVNEIRELQATLAQRLGRRVPVAMAAYRWLEERYYPTIEKLVTVRSIGDTAELYCQVLEHKWYLSERAKQDVGLETAAEDYVKRFQGV